MKISKAEVSEKVTQRCRGFVSSKNRIEEYAKKLYETYDLTNSIAYDILTTRTSIMEYDDNIAYYICDIIYEGKETVINEFFTEVEIRKYSGSKYKSGKIKFPIKWDMIQIAEDQWVGKITAKELMKIRSARLINYNENTQRPLSRKTVNGEEFYYITINEQAVSAIKESFSACTYIPNTITLNIPEDSDFEYSNGQIVINEIRAFDILDGYHRYVALQRLCMEDKSFDCTMELRIVCYPEDKAKQFIWQEDQKTKMSKIDSDSMNQNSIANQVVARLNAKSPFTGIINNNGGKIDSALFARIIDLYFVDDKKKQSRSVMIEISNKVYEHMNMLAEDNPEILDKKWKVEYLVAMIHMIYEGISNSEYVEKVAMLCELLQKEENEQYIHNFKTKSVRKVDITRISKLIGGE